MSVTRRYYRGHNLVAMRDGLSNTSRYFHGDHQGTTQCLTDTVGAVTDRFASDAWGVEVKRTGSALNRHWYVGNLGYYRQFDSSSLYVRARYLATSIGLWLSADPERRMQTFSAGRVYALTSPARYSDASGRIVDVLDEFVTWEDSETAQDDEPPPAKKGKNACGRKQTDRPQCGNPMGSRCDVTGTTCTGFWRRLPKRDLVRPDARELAKIDAICAWDRACVQQGPPCDNIPFPNNVFPQATTACCTLGEPTELDRFCQYGCSFALGERFGALPAIYRQCVWLHERRRRLSCNRWCSPSPIDGELQEAIRTAHCALRLLRHFGVLFKAPECVRNFRELPNPRPFPLNRR